MQRDAARPKYRAFARADAALAPMQILGIDGTNR